MYTPQNLALNRLIETWQKYTFLCKQILPIVKHIDAQMSRLVRWQENDMCMTSYGYRTFHSCPILTQQLDCLTKWSQIMCTGHCCTFCHKFTRSDVEHKLTSPVQIMFFWHITNVINPISKRYVVLDTDQDIMHLWQLLVFSSSHCLFAKKSAISFLSSCIPAGKLKALYVKLVKIFLTRFLKQ